ncbi:hypothetical protein ACI3KW_20555 [Devosia sp. ZW T5_3]|uniref:hypothetical protein n=1 Tax=Devosia sp. ZW T5_3 TaxID=3378085 RepID=UPI003852B53F
MVAAGQGAFVDDQSEAGDLVACHDSIGEAPEAVEEIVGEATIWLDRERHELGHVVEIELDQIGHERLLVRRGGDDRYILHGWTMAAALPGDKCRYSPGAANRDSSFRGNDIVGGRRTRHDLVLRQAQDEVY